MINNPNRMTDVSKKFISFIIYCKSSIKILLTNGFYNLKWEGDGENEDAYYFFIRDAVPFFIPFFAGFPTMGRFLFYKYFIS